MLFNVLLRGSENVLWLARGVLFARDIPDVNVLRIDKERSHIVLINVGRAAEVRNDQPAGEDQLCIWPYRNPVID